MKKQFLWLRRLVALAVLVLFTGLFTVLPWSIAKYVAPLAKIQAVPAAVTCSVGVLAIVAVTLLAGRWYCSLLCPLGIMQDVAWRIGSVKPLSGLRNAKSSTRIKHVQFIVRLAVLGVFLGAAIAGMGYAWLEPYGIFGRVMTVGMFACTLGLAIFLLALWRGRVWCNWICPVGTILGLISRFAPLRLRISKSKCIGCKKCERSCRAAAIEIKARGEGGTIDSTKCVECLDCTALCPKDAIGRRQGKSVPPSADGSTSSPGPADMTRRAFIVGAAATGVSLAAKAVDDKIFDGGFAEISSPGIDARNAPLKPAGSRSIKNFRSKCVGCQLCVRECPNHVLRPSLRTADYMQPEMAFDKGFCTIDCTRCSQVCPAGAIEPITAGEKATIHIGTAVWHEDRCLAASQGVKCTACYRHCPTHAISLVKTGHARIPVVDAIACIGCGACEHVCPARPMPGMTVQSFERHRQASRTDSSDVLAEARYLLKNGKSCVFIQNGSIVHSAEGRGIKPLLDILDGSTPGLFKDAWVVDKVIGRAAASICIVGGAKKVFGEIMSEDARAMLEKYSIEAAADEFVPQILNRDKSGSCPMEQKIQGLDDPREMVEKLGMLPM